MIIRYNGHKKLDKFLRKKYFPSKIGGIAIEAGAYDGVDMSTCKVFECFWKWKCYNVEPNPIVFKSLLKNRPKSININMALSEKIGTSIFEVGKRNKNGHLIGDDGVVPRLQKASEKEPNVRGGTHKYSVITTTYRQLIIDNNIKNLDLLVLDLEGWESSAIKGMYGADILPDVLCVEACPSITKECNYDELISDIFKGAYKKDSELWLNNIYVKVK